MRPLPLIAALTRQQVLRVLIALFVFSAAALPASAQEGGRPNVIAQIFTADGNSSIRLYTPEGTEAGGLVENPTVRVIISPDLRWRVNAGYDATRQTEVLEFSALNGTPIALPIETGFNLLDAGISRDSKYLFYTITNLERRAWAVGIVEFESGKATQFNALFDDSSPVGGGQVGSALDYANGAVLLTAFVPYTDGNFGGVYRFEAQADQIGLGQQTMPPAARLFPAGVNASLALSPDGSQIAFLYGDPANPPAQYQPLGPGFTLNTLAVLTLATGELRVIAQAGVGQALESMSWTSDGTQIIFTGGGYQNSYYIVTPTLFTVDVATGQVNVLTAMTADPAEVIGGLRVCGDTLFFDATKAIDPATGSGGNEATLFAAPLAAAGSRQAVAKGALVATLGCASAG